MVDKSEYSEDQLWGKLAHLLMLTVGKNTELTIMTMMSVLRGANVDPVALAHYIDKQLSAEIRLVCLDLDIPFEEPLPSSGAPIKRELGN